MCRVISDVVCRCLRRLNAARDRKGQTPQHASTKKPARVGVVLKSLPSDSCEVYVPTVQSLLRCKGAASKGSIHWEKPKLLESFHANNKYCAVDCA